MLPLVRKAQEPSPVGFFEGIDTLPHELWVEVFCNCIYGSGNQYDNSTRKNIASISAVCLLWRELTQHCRKLIFIPSLTETGRTANFVTLPPSVRATRREVLTSNRALAVLNKGIPGVSNDSITFSSLDQSAIRQLNPYKKISPSPLPPPGTTWRSTSHCSTRMATTRTPSPSSTTSIPTKAAPI